MALTSPAAGDSSASTSSRSSSHSPVAVQGVAPHGGDEVKKSNLIVDDPYVAEGESEPLRIVAQKRYAQKVCSAFHSCRILFDLLRKNEFTSEMLRFSNSNY